MKRLVRSQALSSSFQTSNYGSSLMTTMTIPQIRSRQPRPRVHVLGLGSIGTFAAYCLSDIPNGPAVTLLLHRKSLLGAYQNNGNIISLETREGIHVSSANYDFEVLHDGQWYHEYPKNFASQWHSDSPAQAKQVAADVIEHLIICVKSTQTVDALRPLLPRLTAQSRILFLQNGFGTVEAVNEQLFADSQTRPNYLIGVISHGVTLNKPFNITHTGFAATSIGMIPRGDRTSGYSSDEFNLEMDYFLKILPQSYYLNATSFPYTSILQIQLEKLAVNAFCNPLCALNDSTNGFLFTIPDTRREILTEISNVVLALPELKHIPEVKERFSVDVLEEMVNGIIQKTYNTTCSMVWDLRAGRETEVRFINGSWSRMGRKLGVATPVNDRLVREIEMKTRSALRG
ncbi:putative 2-dehydropantoate 2-reductase family protein [Bisporella sp. PMI_857]|nr:putative 2-dehydropantoate 2-reductase family protein [Bisporella sp. PMI_857]